MSGGYLLSDLYFVCVIVFFVDYVMYNCFEYLLSDLYFVCVIVFFVDYVMYNCFEYLLSDLYFVCVIVFTLPRAARWNRLNAGCIVGSMHQHN
jgi:hypothetical protein